MNRYYSLSFALLFLLGLIANPVIGQSWKPDTLGTYTLYGTVYTPDSSAAPNVQITIENWPDAPQARTDTKGNFVLAFHVDKEQYDYNMQLAIRVASVDEQYDSMLYRIPVRDFQGGEYTIEKITLHQPKPHPKYKPESIEWFLQQRIDSLRSVISTMPNKEDSLEQRIRELQERLNTAQQSHSETKMEKQIAPPAPKKKVQAFEANKYVVKPGDSLSSIAAKPSIYGDASRWQLIYTENRDVIKNPDLIYPHQILIIPPAD